MNHLLDDTIAAIASAPGGAVRGIIRVSGPGASPCLANVFRADDRIELEDVASPTRLAGHLRLKPTNYKLPCDLLYWPGARSYTRQPLAELHTLGSPPLIEAVLRTLCFTGARVALPGEFTLRAFLAGRLDLTQAEAVLGIIDADNGAQLRVAIAQLAGGLAKPLGQLRDELLDLLAELEAGLDFAEEDIAFVSRSELAARMHGAIDKISNLELQMSARSTASALPIVVLCGPPNVGKSSLFNALARTSAAIVADVPGTTRDYLTATLELDSARCRLVDTAGIGRAEPADELERTAQHATRSQRATADLEILCVDARHTRLTTDETWSPAASGNIKRLVALTKADLRPDAAPTTVHGPGTITTSSATGQGVDDLREAIAHELNALATNSGSVVAATAARCGESLRRARESLARAAGIVDAHRGEELVAAELRIALEELGRVVGAVYTDDILDRIFSRFCIGK